MDFKMLTHHGTFCVPFRNDNVIAVVQGVEALVEKEKQKDQSKIS